MADTPVVEEDIEVVRRIPHSQNVNAGSGRQNNHTITGVSNIRQYNADRIHFENHAAPARAKTPPLPCAIIPFRRDPDYVANAEVDDRLHQKISEPGARVALVGLGGVGKSLCTIEYAHRERRKPPQTWVFWIHASDATRFQESVQQVVEQLDLPHRHDPGVDHLALFEAWLRDARKGVWLLILDNADDVRFLHEAPQPSGDANTNASSSSYQRTRLQRLPVCDHGSILFTSRDRNAALTLVDSNDVIDLERMSEERAIGLLARKLGQQGSSEDLARLARALDFIPLAITQAAAYICRTAPLITVRQYCEQLELSNTSGDSLLDRDEGNLRRDPGASNSVILTWQMSFEHIRRTHPSAADLLSLMSLCERQAIPEILIRESHYPLSKTDVTDREAEKTVDSTKERVQRKHRRSARLSTPRRQPYLLKETIVHEETLPNRNISTRETAAAINFDHDIAILRGYSFTSVTTESATFEMHRLVQLATQRWLVANNMLELWQSRLLCNLEAAQPDSAKYENGLCIRCYTHT